MKLRLAAGIVLGLIASGASAHNRGTSYSQWTLDGAHAEVRARISQLDLTRLRLHPQRTPDYVQRVGTLLSAGLQLWSGDQRCEPSRVNAVPLPDGWVSATWQLQCTNAQPLTVRSSLLLSVSPGHLHLARIERDGAPAVDRVLTYAEPSLAVGTPTAAPSSVGRYVVLGLEHILSGWDHLCFVLALILLATSLREVALIATGFTVAHSLTLAAAVLGWVTAPAAAIEALIGYSIVMVAAENLWMRSGHERWVPGLLGASLLGLAVLGLTGLSTAVLLGLALFTTCYFALVQGTERPLRLRAAVACLFGLVHGFGFAGVMTPLQLPPPQLAAGLFGFNVGVELGQLLVIAAVLPVLSWLRRSPPMRQWTGDSVSAAICALGTFWFVTRAFA